jgi:hypothetical protein
MAVRAVFEFQNRTIPEFMPHVTPLNFTCEVVRATSRPNEARLFPSSNCRGETSQELADLPRAILCARSCVGDAAAFARLLKDVTCNRHGIEVDANRAEQAQTLGIGTLRIFVTARLVSCRNDRAANQARRSRPGHKGGACTESAIRRTAACWGSFSPAGFTNFPSRIWRCYSGLTLTICCSLMSAEELPILMLT